MESVCRGNSTVGSNPTLRQPCTVAKIDHELRLGKPGEGVPPEPRAKRVIAEGGLQFLQHPPFPHFCLTSVARREHDVIHPARIVAGAVFAANLQS